MSAQAEAIEKKLFALILLVQERMRSVLQDVDTRLSPVQVLILRALAGGGPMNQNEISAALERDKSQIAKLMRDLEEHGLVTREVSSADRRSYLIRAVPEVEDTITRISARERAVTEEMLAGIAPEDRARLEALLGTMAANLQSASRSR